MKAEGSASTTIAVLQKITVKEEAKDGGPQSRHQGSPSSTNGGSATVTSPANITACEVTAISKSPPALADTPTSEEGGKSRDPGIHNLKSKGSPSQPVNQARDKPEPEGKRTSKVRPSGSESPTSVKPEDTRGKDASEAEARCISSVFAGHSKLKRLLGTLVHFANNISAEVGDTVRALILSLLSGGLSAEEFHAALQEATNFPLRDFVLPYLKHTLPTLRKNLNAAARASNVSCIQYLRANESAVLETVSLVSSSDTVQLFSDHTSNGNTSGYPTRAHAAHQFSGTTGVATKRRASDALYYENGAADELMYGKRWSQQSDYCWYHPLHTSQPSQGPSLLPPTLVQGGPGAYGPPPQPGQSTLSLDDEWKNIHVMLNCILGMVEKTKRALVILQRRGCSSPAAAASPQLGLIPNGANATCTNGDPPTDRDGNLKRLSGEIVAQTIRATEDRVAAEVKRRAEEAVQEVKRAAMAEVQRAVAAAVAESRASERLRVHQLLDISLPRNQHVRHPSSFLRLGGSSGTSEHASKGETSASSLPDDSEKETNQLTSGSSCWNCGRPALETCGGCGIARYCGSFCQHRDWEAGGHHATCSSPYERRRSSSRSPTKVNSNDGGDADEENSPNQAK